MSTWLANKYHIKKCFDAAALTYDNNCDIIYRVGKELIHMAKALPVSHLMDVGCGTGLITQQLAHSPYKTFHAVDIAANLLYKAFQRLSVYNIHTYIADYDYLPIGNSYLDLVFSNMALQWSVNIPQTLQEMSRVIRPGGYLAFSIPLVGTFYELKPQTTITLYAANFWLDVLKKCGFELLNFYQKKYILKFNHIKNALSSIKKIGAHYSPLRLHKGLSKNFNSYQKKLLDDFVSLTYVIGFFLLKKQNHVT